MKQKKVKKDVKKESVAVYNGKNLLTSEVASKDIDRPALGYTRFENDKTLATDSFSLLEISTPGLKTREYPDIQKKKPLKNFKPFEIKTDDIKTKKHNMPIVDDTFVILEVTDDKVKIGTNSLETSNVTEINKFDGEFPDMEKVKPDEKDYAFVKVSTEYLKRLLTLAHKFAEERNKDKDVFIGLSKKDNKKPIILKKKNTDQTFYGLLMPKRSD